SASFVLDKHHNNKPISLTPSLDSPPPLSDSMAEVNCDTRHLLYGGQRVTPDASSYNNVIPVSLTLRTTGHQQYPARKIIAVLSQDFIFDGCTILVHGFSRVVLEILKTAAQNKKLFRVLCTEGRPDKTGVLLAKELAKLDVPVKLLIDSAVAYIAWMK
ncbi:hypothetical protein F2Q69_00047020, partial [Brassica cretica]